MAGYATSERALWHENRAKGMSLEVKTCITNTITTILNQGEIISNVLNISEPAPNVRLPTFVVTDAADHPTAILRTTSEQAANPTVPVTKAAAPKPLAQSKCRLPSDPDSGIAEHVPSVQG